MNNDEHSLIYMDILQKGMIYDTTRRREEAIEKKEEGKREGRERGVERVAVHSRNVFWIRVLVGNFLSWIGSYCGIYFFDAKRCRWMTEFTLAMEEQLMGMQPPAWIGGVGDELLSRKSSSILQAAPSLSPPLPPSTIAFRRRSRSLRPDWSSLTRAETCTILLEQTWWLFSQLLRILKKAQKLT